VIKFLSALNDFLKNNPLYLAHLTHFCNTWYQNFENKIRIVGGALLALETIIGDGDSLELELCPSPVTALGAVADCVASSHPNPLGNGTILLHLLGELCLDTESLVSRNFENVFSQRRFTRKKLSALNDCISFIT
jgi:hypothetical protein